MINKIKRFLSDTNNSKNFYFIWALLFLLIVLFYGILPVSKRILTKVSLNQKMLKYNKNLDFNARRLSELEKELEAAQDYIPLLNRYLPQSSDIQNYLVDFTSALNGTGFSLNRFTVVDEQNHKIKAHLIGSGEEETAIRRIEELKRITNIEKISVSYDVDGKKILVLDLSIVSVN